MGNRAFVSYAFAMRKLQALLLFLAITAIFSQAQISEKKFHLASIKVTGAKSFTEAEIIAASGLHLNTEVNQQSLLDATNALAATGVFETVVYQFTPATANSLSVTF